MVRNRLSFDENAISDDDRYRFHELFNKLDVNKDGTIDVLELAAALEGRKDAHGQASMIMKKADTDCNAVIDLDEFVKYMLMHERKLHLAFTSLDKNSDGTIEPSEVQMAMAHLGINITFEEACVLTKRIDKNHDQKIDWSEWRDYFNIGPEDSLEEMLSIWHNPPMIDIGEQLTCPPEFPKPKGSHVGVSWRHLVAGGVAGAVSRTVTAPLDRLKVLLQVYGTNLELGLAGGMRHMIKEGGVRSLWRGNGMSVVKIAPESAIKFATYELMKKWLKGDGVKDITVMERFVAGSTAGAVAQTAIFPFEVIKTRLAISVTGQYNGIVDCAYKILHKDGLKAFYRGYIPNLIGIIPYAGIDLAVYETLKLLYVQRHGQQVPRDPGVLVLLACGTVSSTCGQLASYPLALVRTRLQAQVTVNAHDGFVAVLRGIVKTEGLKGLYRGLIPNFVKVLPAVSISYVVYERSKTALGIM